MTSFNDFQSRADPTAPQQAGPDVERAARAYCRRHHPGASKWTLDEALINVDRYWRRYVYEVREILDAARATQPPPTPEDAVLVERLNEMSRTLQWGRDRGICREAADRIEALSGKGGKP